MTHLGIGVLLRMLSGNEDSAKLAQSIIGKKITRLEMKDDALWITFEGDETIRIRDDGQSCCESRYMMTDDNLPDFVGSTLTDMELRDAPDITDEYGETHEVQFLLVNTSLGTFTMATHNEHNGYYGGFWIVVERVDQK